MNRQELIRIVVWQYAIVVFVGLFVGIIWGFSVGLSAVAGGFCVAIPNSVLALNLLLAQIARKPMSPMGVIIGEFLKIFVTCLLFVVVAKFFPGINWPAMLAGIIAAVCSQFALIFVKH